MIDTDKYEGHTEGPWGEMAVSEDTVYCGPALIESDDETAQANGRLIADAPLLLAEVKELRRQIKVAQGVFEYLYDDELEDAYWIRWFCNMEDEEE
jgi:hypothetical protein